MNSLTPYNSIKSREYNSTCLSIVVHGFVYMEVDIRLRANGKKDTIEREKKVRFIHSRLPISRVETSSLFWSRAFDLSHSRHACTSIIDLHLARRYFTVERTTLLVMAWEKFDLGTQVFDLGFEDVQRLERLFHLS